ncbi:MAG: HAD hydrolase family protein [Acidobacteria bacterium]|jgi:3-deoxy-D-manno-octulosonate 8-phosphate phosphatase (KDO 8-P phosphatase)|nr:HAD hydrolase family protein [Acidobacteriota bacterium]
MGKQNLTDDVLVRARKIKLLLMDCDGVLTDGRLYYTESGEQMKVFNVRDGQGIVLWHKAGFRSGIISGRDAKKILEARATELGMHYIKARSHDKAKNFLDILQDAKVAFNEVAYIGDDVGDISLMEKVGLPIAVADAVSEVLPYAVYKTEAKGGFGAVREVTDLLLRAKEIF